MGKRTQSMIGTENGVATVRVFSANPKTADGYNTFIFRRMVEKSVRKLSWISVIDGRGNPLPEGVQIGDKTVEYTEAEKASIRKFVVDVATGQKGPLFNDDFGNISIGRDFVKEIQQHCISTRRDVAAVSSARDIALRMVHFVASPNQEAGRRNGVLYFEYGLAKLMLDDGLYLVMGEVGVRMNSQPYYDQRVVAKFKADSEAPSLHGHLRIGESAFDVVYDSRFRLILQGVDLYFLHEGKTAPFFFHEGKTAPFFSIIIPVYNVAPYLRECLDSVLAQTFTDWEAICVDDGSTDGSSVILDEYSAKDPRFHVIHQQNAGVSAARNAALEAIRGEWFLFLDGDDLLREDALAMFEPYIRKDSAPDGILVCPYVCGWDGGEIPEKKIQTHVLVANASKEDLFLGPHAANGYVMARIYRRSKFECLRFRADMALCEDVCFWFDAVCLNARWMILNVEYYLYRERVDSACRSINPHKCVQALESILYAVRDIGRIIGLAEDCKYRYLRRFPVTVVHYLNLAIAHRNELSNDEWYEIVGKVENIESEAGGWPYGCGLKIRVKLAAKQQWRFLLPLALSFERVCMFARRTGGRLLREVGLRKNYV